MTDTRYGMPQDISITALLGKRNQGDREAESQLVELMYKELRRLAHCYMRKESPGHILQTTALVNEAYLRFAQDRKTKFKNKGHFLAIAANTMRRVLVEIARKRDSIKRGGRVQTISLEDAFVYTDEQSWQVAAIDEALRRLEKLAPRQCQIVEFRLFAGLTVEETAELMGISVSTVKSEYRVAKIWLYDQLSKSLEKAGGQ